MIAMLLTMSLLFNISCFIEFLREQKGLAQFIIK